MKTFSLTIVSVFLFLLFGVNRAFTENPATTVSVMSENFPPYAYAEKGLIKGVATEIVKEVFRQMGQAFSLQVGDFGNTIKKIEASGVDAFYCIPREMRFEFLLDFMEQPLLERKISFFVLQNKDISFDGDLSVLKDKAIVLVKNVDYGSEILEATKAGYFTIKIVDDYGHAIDLLLAGKVDLMPADEMVMNVVLDKLKLSEAVYALEEPVTTISYYIGFSRSAANSELKQTFASVFADIKKGQQYKELIQKALRQI